MRGHLTTSELNPLVFGECCWVSRMRSGVLIGPGAMKFWNRSTLVWPC